MTHNIISDDPSFTSNKMKHSPNILRFSYRVPFWVNNKSFLNNYYNNVYTWTHVWIFWFVLFTGKTIFLYLQHVTIFQYSVRSCKWTWFSDYFLTYFRFFICFFELAYDDFRRPRRLLKIELILNHHSINLLTVTLLKSFCKHFR